MQRYRHFVAPSTAGSGALGIKTALLILGCSCMKLTMSPRLLLRALCALVVSVATWSPSAFGASAKYRGFTIDTSAVAKSEEAAQIRRAIEEQIDIVYLVGVPDALMQFFQCVPLDVVPRDAIPRTSPGLYGPNLRMVKITSRIVSIGRRPVLLHELLHAYHHQKMPSSYQNPEIRSFYEAARKLNLYPPKSHMMQNDREFFACAATTFLFGVTGQEPYERDKVKQHQPDLQRFLEKIFGSNAGHYAGSMPHSGAIESGPN